MSKMHNINGGAEEGITPEVHTFEQAVELTGHGRFHLFLLLTTGTALLGVVIEGLNMAFVLPAAKCELNISNTEQGLINAVAFLGVVLTSHFWGFMADTWGRRKVLQCALGSGFVFSAVSSLSTTSTMLLITRFCVGLCISGVQAAAISYLGEFHSNETRSKHVTFAAMFMTLSIVYQPLMGLFIMPRQWQFSLFGLMIIRPWRIYIVFSSCTSALAFIAITFLPESPKFMLAMENQDKALDILRQAFAANGKGKPEDFPVHRIALLETSGSNLSDVKGVGAMFRMIWKQTRPLLHKDHIGNVILMCYLTFALFAVAHGFYMWYPQVLSLYYPFMDHSVTTCDAVMLGYRNITIVAKLYSNPESSLLVQSEQTACEAAAEPLTYYIILIMGCCFVAIYCLVALNSNRFGMKILLSGWLMVSGLTTMTLLWTNHFYLNVGLLILMHTCGNCGSILSAVSADLFPTHFKGMALCFVMMSGRIGAVVGSNFVGAVLTERCDSIFIVFTCLLTVSVGVCYYVLHKKERLTQCNT